MTRYDLGRPFNERGMIAASTTYNPYDVVWYSGRRVLITQLVTTGSTGTPPFLSAANYIQLTPQDWVNVKSFGAKGDASTDDTVAIQRAIDWVSTQASGTGGGGTVFFPQGFYVISATLILGKHVYLRGEGMATSTIKLAANANCDIVTNAQPGHFNVAGTADFCGLVDISLDGNKASNPTGGHGVNFTTSAGIASGDSFFDMHHVIRNVRVYKTKGDAFHFTGRSGIEVTNAYAQQADGYGFYSTYDTNFTNCEADFCGKSGYWLNNGSIRLSCCKSYLSGQVDGVGAGFELGSNANGVTMAAVEAQNNKGAGFYLNGCNRVHIAGVADSNNTSGPTAGGSGTYPALQMVSSNYNVVDLVCWQGTQSGARIGDQNAALSIDTGSTANSLRLSHSGNGTTVTGAIKAASVLSSANSVVINGAAVSPGTF